MTLDMRYLVLILFLTNFVMFFATMVHSSDKYTSHLIHQTKMHMRYTEWSHILDIETLDDKDHMRHGHMSDIVLYTVTQLLKINSKVKSGFQNF